MRRTGLCVVLMLFTYGISEQARANPPDDKARPAKEASAAYESKKLAKGGSPLPTDRRDGAAESPGMVSPGGVATWDWRADEGNRGVPEVNGGGIAAGAGGILNCSRLRLDERQGKLFRIPEEGGRKE